MLAYAVVHVRVSCVFWVASANMMSQEVQWLSAKQNTHKDAAFF